METPLVTLDAELTLQIGGAPLANRKRMELLRQIGVTENLTKAAKIAGYSYKGAWDTIEQMTQLTGGTLLERHAGGKGGGRTRLTERGRQLLKNFELIEGEHQRFVARLNKLANGLEDDYAARAEIAMKTSARNQFAALIVRILQGPVNDEITLMVNGSQMLKASITHASSRDLRLDIGAKVFALIKASSVAIRPRTARPDGATQNVLPGMARAITVGESKSEVAVRLDSDTELIATLPNEELNASGVQAGDPISVVFDPASVIIGVAA